jgi:DNA anti-recombination protein RmuC
LQGREAMLINEKSRLAGDLQVTKSELEAQRRHHDESQEAVHRLNKELNHVKAMLKDVEQSSEKQLQSSKAENERLSSQLEDLRSEAKARTSQYNSINRVCL